MRTRCAVLAVFFFRQRQLIVAVDANITLNDVAGDILRFLQRVHGVGSALVDVQLRDLILIFDFQHVSHRRFPGIGHALLFRRTNQAHVETGTAAHRRNVDNFHAITVQVIAHETSKQVLQCMNTALRHHFTVRYAESQIEKR